MKYWISEERNMTFPWNKETLKFCLKDYIFRSYDFLGEVAFSFYMTEDHTV